MNSISLPLSTKSRDKQAFNAIVYKHSRKLWIYIRWFWNKGEGGAVEFIDSDKKKNIYAGCFVKKCSIKRTCSFPYYYMREE